jgi:hypothetical protein
MVFTFLWFQIYAMCTLDFSWEFESMDKVFMMWNMTYFTVCSACVLLMKFAYLDDSREYFQMVSLLTDIILHGNINQSQGSYQVNIAN